MGDEIPNIDVTVDKEKYDEGLLKVLEYIRPNWKKQDIKFEVNAQYLPYNSLTLCESTNQDFSMAAQNRRNQRLSLQMCNGKSLSP